ncbi:alpha/beta fold hydrolase [Baekduia soli]|uniref:alpha/beta fold hydrolase n=1 Tax=Baekduia soli TaxID=496014 RepID=UPI0016523ECC|nr:alpha/beta hydrolase [Baekduia soli]
MTNVVHSPTGVDIAVRRGGCGRPLVAVHGGMTDARWWDPVRPHLEPHRELWTPDRRDHGASGSGSDPYRLQDEVADVTAVLQAAGPGTDLLAHSYGGLVALEASLHADVRRMVLYEPSLGSDPELAGVAAELERLVGDGALDDAVALLMTRRFGIAPEVLDDIRRGPRWRDAAATIAAVPRQGHVAATYALDPARFAGHHVPTLVLVGSTSPPWRHQLCGGLADALPDGRLVVLQGHGHVAAVTAPEAFAAVVLGFLGDDGGADR